MGLPDSFSDAERHSLERLALADRSEAAEAQVHSITVMGRKAAVNLLLNGDYEYWVYFQQDERGQWDDAGSSNGHAARSVLEAIHERP